MITANSDVRTVTISDAGVVGILAGTPMASAVSSVEQYAAQYDVDPNFFLSYVHWENGFLTENTFSGPYNNPYDIVCVNAPCNDGNCSPNLVGNCGDPSGNNFANGCSSPGNGWCYTTYPSLATGIQAALWQTNLWFGEISTQWGALLSVAGFGSGQLPSILATANQNAATYPPGSSGGGGCPSGYVLDPSSGLCVLSGEPAGSVVTTAGVLGLGLLALAGAVYLGTRVNNG